MLVVYLFICNTVFTKLSLAHGHLVMGYCVYKWGGVSGVMVTVVGNGHGDPSSNSGRGCLYFI